MRSSLKILFTLCLLMEINSTLFAGTLSCSITTAAACTSGTILLRMSGSVNAHAELPSQSTAGYASNVVCCTGVRGLSNACSGTQATVLKLASTSNSHVQENVFSNYTNNACMSVGSGGTVSIGYQSGSCTGFDTTLLSIASTSNSQVGGPAAYTIKVCGSGTSAAQSLSFAISTSTVYFGQVSSVLTRYASSTNVNGDGSEVEAHNFTVITNADNGYTVTMRGATLTSGSSTIAAIGATPVTPSIGTEQFGLRIVASGGLGTTTTPYNGTQFAYTATATTSAQVASASYGDSATTTYSVRYVTNISGVTNAASYSTSIVYVATSNF
jgi:hypothetical protein